MLLISNWCWLESWLNGGPFEVYGVRVQARFFSGRGEQIADVEAPAAFGKLEAETYRAISHGRGRRPDRGGEL